MDQRKNYIDSVVYGKVKREGGSWDCGQNDVFGLSSCDARFIQQVDPVLLCTVLSFFPSAYLSLSLSLSASSSSSSLALLCNSQHRHTHTRLSARPPTHAPVHPFVHSICCDVSFVPFTQGKEGMDKMRWKEAHGLGMWKDRLCRALAVHGHGHGQVGILRVHWCALWSRAMSTRRKNWLVHDMYE